MCLKLRTDEVHLGLIMVSSWCLMSGLWLRYFLSMVTRSGFFSNQCTGVMIKQKKKKIPHLWWVWRKWLVISVCHGFFCFYPKKILFWLYHSNALQLKAGLLQAARLLACSMEEAVSEAAKPLFWAGRAQRWRRQGKEASTESCIWARLWYCTKVMVLASWYQ